MEAVLGKALWDLRYLAWQIAAEDYPLYLNDAELENKNKTANCSIVIYGQPYNEICNETKLDHISVAPFNQFKALDEMDFDKEYGEVSISSKYLLKFWLFVSEICSRSLLQEQI